MLTKEATEFQQKIMSYPNTSNLMACLNCGTCTASCPSSDFMEFGPRAMIRGIITGDVEDVRRSPDPWKCVQCFMCDIKCPRDVRPVYVMRALKEIAMEENNVPEIKNLVSKEKKLQKIFVKQIKKSGRISEFHTAVDYKGLIGSAKEMDLGLELLLTGRIKIKNVIKYGLTFGQGAESQMPNIEARDQVRRMMERFYTKPGPKSL